MAADIIDMRSRPSFLHDFYGASPGTKEYDVVKWLNRRVGSKDDEHFTRSKNVKAFVDEIRECGIRTAVIVGRDIPGIRHSNDEIHKITNKHKELLGMGSVDPFALGSEGSAREVERAIKELGLAGINIEPGFASTPTRADDPIFFPIYEVCEQLQVPVSLMSGPTTPNFELTDPAPVGRVARAFPNLSIICYHGFYPYVNEMIGVAFRYENVFVVPDMYIFLPGGSLYVEAANGFMKDQLLFGSSYPFRAMGQSIDDYRNLGFRDDVMEKVFSANAKRVLKIR
jgi:predicted TIM-barrel fold metal-dependent hydrolase